MLKRCSVLRIATVFLMAVALYSVVTVASGECSSHAAVKKVLAGWKSQNLFKWDDDYELSRSTREREFDISRKSYVMIQYKIITDGDEDYEYPVDVGEIDKGRVRFEVLNPNGKIVDSYNVNMSGYDVVDDVETGWWSTDKKLKAGDYYTLRIKSSGYSGDFDIYYKVKTRIISYTKYAAKASINKKVKVKADRWVKIGKFGKGLPYFGSIKHSKPSVTEGYWIKYDGSLWVYANKRGKSTVTVKLKNGKKYRAKVYVTAGDPNFFAYIYDYNTRGNYFVVKIKNLGVTSLTVIRKGSKVKDKDYRSYDRKMKSSKRITIKPGQTKKVKFYVRGRTTWYNSEHFTLYSRFKYQGKTRYWKAAYNYSWYKKGKEWYNTFWNFDDYDEWS